jgi:hypothetical protein
MLSRVLIGISSWFLLLACSGGEGGLDGDKDLGSLNDSEVTAFCEFSESLINLSDFSELSCYDDAIASTQAGGDCETIFAQCIAESQPFDLECGQNPTNPFPECASLVTVAELQICMADRAELLNDRDITCESASEEVGAIFSEYFNGPLPASCREIEETCPVLVAR